MYHKRLEALNGTPYIACKRSTTQHRYVLYEIFENGFKGNCEEVYSGYIKK